MYYEKVSERERERETNKVCAENEDPKKTRCVLLYASAYKARLFATHTF
jgi:hypothetical protein